MTDQRQPRPTRKLTSAQKHEIAHRERRHRSRLARLGYTTRTLIDEAGCFGIVLVEDPTAHRVGLLLPDGQVRWMQGSMRPGALSDAAVSALDDPGH
ncbi:hypothetical protein ACFYWX_39350 [Streptomyces sp. NPDC002888]|uniref:hypothetical protein n=1 Tax=Streptomyces sp. NPDC002888 TaxID=3364668 RepID=UPI0036CB9C2B